MAVEGDFVCPDHRLMPHEKRMMFVSVAQAIGPVRCLQIISGSPIETTRCWQVTGVFLLI